MTEQNQQRLETLNKALDHTCKLMDCYRILKGETEFAPLIGDYRYAALVAIQIETFDEIRKLELQ